MVNIYTLFSACVKWPHGIAYMTIICMQVYVHAVHAVFSYYMQVFTVPDITTSTMYHYDCNLQCYVQCYT